MNDVTSSSRSLAEIKRQPLVVQDESIVLDTAKFEQLQRFAAIMSQAKLVPAHLQGSIGDCFMVCQQAMRWKMDPFAVAQKTHVIQGRLGYEAQLIAAVINSRAPLKTRLNVQFKGSGSDLVCVVSATMEGEDEPRIKESPKISEITTKNSPLWKVDPAQQLAYWTQRAWARLHCPDVLLGVYTNDELDTIEMERDSRGTYIVPPRPTMSFDASPPSPRHEGAAEENRPEIVLVDEVGGEESRHHTADQFATALAAASAPTDGKLGSKAQAYLRNNLETWTALEDKVENDDVVKKITVRYQAMAAHARKAEAAAAQQQATEPAAPAQPAGPQTITMPTDKNGKPDTVKYSEAFRHELAALTGKEQIVDLLKRETDNFKKILPGARLALAGAACIERWVALGGKQEEFETAVKDL